MRIVNNFKLLSLQMTQLRFRISHLIIATTLVALCLVAGLLFVRAARHRRIIAVYGNYDAYDLLRESHEFAILRVQSDRPPLVAGIDPGFPARVMAFDCGTVSHRNARRLRDLLVSPENFMVDYTKSYLFQPSILVRTGRGDKQLDIYLCFDSKIAALILNGQRVGVLIIDKVSHELRDITSSVCGA